MHLIRSIAQAIFALLATLFAVGASAQQPAAVATTALPAPAPRPALWKVADADTTIYLFGTIHALPAGVQWMNGPIEQALASSEQLVTEIPDTPPEEMKAAVLSNAMLPAGQNLRQLLDDDQRAKFESALTSFGFPVDAFDRFEPWYAAVALTALPLEKIGYTAGNGVEEHIAAEAERLKKPRMGLETAAYQLAMFDGLPRDVQKAYLMEVLHDLPTIREDLAAIVTEWSAGNADKLADLLNAEQDDPRMVAALLTGRNKMWARWIKARLNRPGTVFMAVGAGHLAGKDSVQDLLGKAGLTVTRIQ